MGYFKKLENVRIKLQWLRKLAADNEWERGWMGVKAALSTAYSNHLQQSKSWFKDCVMQSTKA